MHKKLVYKVSIISIIVNLLLAIFKFITGLFTNSSAMVSDSIHSLTDGLIPIIVMIGVKFSTKEADFEHPYGHEKLESLTTMILSIILSITGISLGYSAIINIINKKYLIAEIPGSFALVAAVISIIVKEIMYRYTKMCAKKIDSQVLMADAYHHRTDSLSSFGSLIGTLASRCGLLVFDSLATIAISFLILKTAMSIFFDSFNRIIDHSCPKEQIEKMKDIVLKNKDVMGIDSIKTRLFGSKIYVDLEIILDGNKTLTESSIVSDIIHDELEGTFLDIKHCMIHIKPDI